MVTDTAHSLFAEQFQLIASGGNAYTSCWLLTYLYDMEIILLTYLIFSGDASVLKAYYLNGLQDTYLVLRTPSFPVGTNVQTMKDAANENFLD